MAKMKMRASARRTCMEISCNTMITGNGKNAHPNETLRKQLFRFFWIYQLHSVVFIRMPFKHFKYESNSKYYLNPLRLHDATQICIQMAGAGFGISFNYAMFGWWNWQECVDEKKKTARPTCTYTESEKYFGIISACDSVNRVEL